MSAAAHQHTGVEKMAPHIASQARFAMVRKFTRQACVLALGVAGLGLAQQKAGTSPFHAAETLLAEHRLAEARTEAIEQLKTHASVEGYNLLGIIESDQQDYQAAVSSFEQALRLSPKSAKTLNNLGNAYAAQKQWDLAESKFRTVLRMDPANADANYNLGVLLMMKGSAADAIPHFERVRTTESQFNLVRAYLQTHRTAEALRTADSLSDNHKGEVQVQFSLGVLLASAQQYKAAQRLLNRAESLEPDRFEILFNLGQVLLRAGDNNGAELTLNRALKIQPANAEALYLLAQTYVAQSRPLDALNVLMQAHKNAPQNADLHIDGCVRQTCSLALPYVSQNRIRIYVSNGQGVKVFP